MIFSIEDDIFLSYYSNYANDYQYYGGRVLSTREN